MKYHLEEWFDDNPKEINHLIFSWENGHESKVLH